MHRLADLLSGFGELAKGCAVWVMRGLEQTRNGGRRRRMKVVESLALGGRRQLLLVMCDEQEYLVGAGAEGVETIVLRPPDGVQAGQMQEARVPTGAAQTAGLKAGVAQAGVVRTETAVRSRPTRGPWLVAPGVQGVAENRIHEAEIGKGRHLWQ